MFIDDEDSLDRKQKHTMISLGGLPKSDKDGVYYEPAQLDMGSHTSHYMKNMKKIYWRSSQRRRHWECLQGFHD